MNIRPLLPARIDKGRILYGDPVQYSRVLSALEGQEVSVSIKPRHKSRSNRQNRYYRGCVLEILSDWNGDIPDDWHEWLKMKFLSTEKEINGERFIYARSTTTLSTSEFEDYMQKIREWASVKLNLYIPKPNEVDL